MANMLHSKFLQPGVREFWNVGERDAAKVFYVALPQVEALQPLLDRVHSSRHDARHLSATNVAIQRDEGLKHGWVSIVVFA